jgi:hypothetical protein
MAGVDLFERGSGWDMSDDWEMNGGMGERRRIYRYNFVPAKEI